MTSDIVGARSLVEQPRCPERASGSSRGQRPRKRVPPRNRPCRGRRCGSGGEAPQRQRLFIRPLQGRGQGMPVPGGVAPGYYMNPLRGFSAFRPRPASKIVNRQPASPDGCAGLAVYLLSCRSQLEEVVAHNGEGNGLAKVVTVPANGLREELPILLAVVVEDSLSPE